MGILHEKLSLPAGMRLEVGMLSKHQQACVEIAAGQARCVLTDLRWLAGVEDLEAIGVLAAKEQMEGLKLAQAFVVNSMSGWLVANMLARQATACPVKVFLTEEEAMAWLKRILKHTTPKNPKQNRKSK